MYRYLNTVSVTMQDIIITQQSFLCLLSVLSINTADKQ